MKLNQDDVPCDCEKDTNSDSCGKNCSHSEDIFKWLKNNEENCDIFDIDVEQVEEQYNDCLNGRCPSVPNCPI